MAINQPPPPPPPSGNLTLTKSLDAMPGKGKTLYNGRHGNPVWDLQKLATYYQANYTTTVTQDNGSVAEYGLTGTFYKVVTQYKNTSGSSSEYRNYIDAEHGVLFIESIQRNDSVEKIDGKLFPCSEILYQQFRQVCGIAGKPCQLQQIMQIGVTGSDPKTGLSSQQVIYKYYDQKTPSATFDANTDGFYAILATLNGKNAVFLITDHGQDLHIGSITSLKTFRKGDIVGAGKLCFSVFYSSNP